MELIADTPRVTIFDDYGHHPTEVRAALDAARQRVGSGRRLWAVFEPHMYSRTALLMDAFSTAFTDADEVVIADIFASRDTPEAMAATSAEHLADAIERASGVPAIATGDVDATTDYVAEHLGDGDAVLVMGAGQVVPHRAGPGRAARRGAGVVIGARSAILGALLALAVAIAYQGIVRPGRGLRRARPAGRDPDPAAGRFPGRADRGRDAHAASPGRHGADGARAGLDAGPRAPGGNSELRDAALRRRRGADRRAGAGAGDRHGGFGRHARGPGRATLMGTDPDRELLDEQIAYYRARATEYDATAPIDGEPFAEQIQAVRAAIDDVRTSRSGARARRRHRAVDRPPGGARR